MKHLSLVMALVAACSGSDADVEGDYTIALTNRDNGCMFANWTVGDQTTGVPVVIGQDGSNVTATVNGGAGLVLDVALGARTYTGDIDGDDLVLELFGTRGQQMGNCSFTYNSTIDATLDDDSLTGRIEYRAATNGNPDCSALEDCLSFQDFNGTRPPP
ncbi:MAG: hypothetical protein ABI867_01320 [Kofleriaceae bacterium]